MKKLLIIIALAGLLGITAYTLSQRAAVIQPAAVSTVDTSPATLKAVSQAPEGSSDYLGEDLQPAAGPVALSWRLVNE